VRGNGDEQVALEGSGSVAWAVRHLVSIPWRRWNLPQQGGAAARSLVLFSGSTLASEQGGGFVATRNQPGNTKSLGEVIQGRAIGFRRSGGNRKGQGAWCWALVEVGGCG
jgi:hypothetical protein